MTPGLRAPWRRLALVPLLLPWAIGIAAGDPRSPSRKVAGVDVGAIVERRIGELPHPVSVEIAMLRAQLEEGWEAFRTRTRGSLRQYKALQKAAPDRLQRLVSEEKAKLRQKVEQATLEVARAIARERGLEAFFRLDSGCFVAFASEDLTDLVYERLTAAAEAEPAVAGEPTVQATPTP